MELRSNVFLFPYDEGLDTTVTSLWSFCLIELYGTDKKRQKDSESKKSHETC